MNLKKHLVEKKLRWYEKEPVKMTARTALEISSGILATQGGITGVLSASLLYSRLAGYRNQISAKLASIYNLGT